jgi:hypothetical protein
MKAHHMLQWIKTIKSKLLKEKEDNKDENREENSVDNVRRK